MKDVKKTIYIILGVLVVILLWSFAYADSSIRGVPPEALDFNGKLVNHGSPLFLKPNDYTVLENFRYYDDGIGTRLGMETYTSDSETNQTFKIIPFDQENVFYVLAYQASTTGISAYQIESGSFSSSVLYSTSGVTTTPITYAQVRDSLVVADSAGVSIWAGTSVYPTALLVEDPDETFTDYYEWIYDKKSHNVTSGQTLWVGYSRPFDAWQTDKDDSTWDTGVGLSSVTPDMKGGQFRYWAWCETTGTSTVELPKIKTSFRPLQNFWAGEDWLYADSAIFIKSGSSEYRNYTGFVADESTETYMDISEMESGGSIAFGFRYPVKEIRLFFPETNKNDNLVVSGASIWNGSGLEGLANYSDGTSHDGAAFAQTGSLTFDKPTNIERRIFGNNPDSLYWYFIGIESGASVANYARIYKAVGIPDDDSVNDDHYTGVVGYQGKRVILYNGDDKSILKISAENQPDVFNGSDTIEYQLGGKDKVVTALPLADGLLVFKQSSGVYFFEGVSVSTFLDKKLDGVPTCVAPESATVVNHEGVPIAVYQASDGVYFVDKDGQYRPIGEDIKAYWDSNSSLAIPQAWLDDSVGIFDKKNYSYQLLIASGSGATQFTHELAYDLKKAKWTVFNRDDSVALSTFTSFVDEDNKDVVLGGDYNGQIYTLDVSNDDGGGINYELHTSSNAASDPYENESGTTTGWTENGLTGPNTFGVTNDSSVGTYAFLVSSKNNPTINANISWDTGGSLTVGAEYTLTYTVKHSGTGGDWGGFLGPNDITSNFNVQFDTITNAETNYATIKYTYIYSTQRRFIIFGERNGPSDGEIYLDNLSLQKGNYFTIISDLTKKPYNLNNNVGKNELRAMALYYDLPDSQTTLTGNTAYLTPSLSVSETTYQEGFDLDDSGFSYINLVNWRTGNKGYTHKIRYLFPGRINLYREILWSQPAPWPH